MSNEQQADKARLLGLQDAVEKAKTNRAIQEGRRLEGLKVLTAEFGVQGREAGRKKLDGMADQLAALQKQRATDHGKLVKNFSFEW